MSEARAAEASGATPAVEVENGTARGVSTAHLKAFQKGLQGRLFAEPHVVATLTHSRHSAAEAGDALGTHRATM
jgi:hypothetical protein